MQTSPTVSRTPRTPAQKHAAARQSQAMGRFGGVLILLTVLGVPALFVGLILYGMARRSRRRYAIVLLGMLVGMTVIGLSYRTVLAHAEEIAQTSKPYQAAVSRLLKAPSQQQWQAVQPLVNTVLPEIMRLWLMTLPLASCVAIYLESTRVKTLPELRADKERQDQQRERMQRRAAVQKVKQAPDQLKGLPIIGVALGGDLPDWRVKEWMTYPAALLNRHAVIIGGSGTGKTEFILRVAYLARKVYGWKVFYIDAKGDPQTARRFYDVMQLAGVARVPLFPDEPYNGWVGDATAILNRMVSVEDYSEPYYKAVAKTVLTLAIKAREGPPESSQHFLKRLRLDALAGLYEGERSILTEALGSLAEEHVDGVLRRYFGFFDALSGKLDGEWSFDSVDAAYFLLEGLALKEEARSLGRYLLEDFANYASKRKAADQRILLIVDEFSALSQGGADAANLFERLRSFGAGIMVTSQTNEGLGEDAKKLIGAAAVTIAFQCADPEPIAERAGKMREVQGALAVEYTATPGRNLLVSGKEHLAGTSVEREQEVFKLHPDTIRRLDVGECCIITNGAYQTVRVARLPEKASARRTKQSASTVASRRAAIEITPRPAARPAPELAAASSSEQAQETEELSVEELDLVQVEPLQDVQAPLGPEHGNAEPGLASPDLSAVTGPTSKLIVQNNEEECDL